MSRLLASTRRMRDAATASRPRMGKMTVVLHLTAPVGEIRDRMKKSHSSVAEIHAANAHFPEPGRSVMIALTEFTNGLEIERTCPFCHTLIRVWPVERVGLASRVQLWLLQRYDTMRGI